MFTLAILLTLRSLLKRRYPKVIERTNALIKSNVRILQRLVWRKKSDMIG